MLGLLHLRPGDLFHRFAYMRTDIAIAGCAHQARTVVSGSDPGPYRRSTPTPGRELDSLYVVGTRFFPQHQHGEPALTTMASALAVGHTTELLPGISGLQSGTEYKGVVLNGTDLAAS